ncbi:hypothetical protein UVI_02055780 [Ustilaginoidea virens]|uniref:Uncharacterized protein n=1 Tax=Ustilaginoidea virens TaxID=1159556 RepID=A0A1B5KY59_USTVR|nr:hypothetical protein UVI_02055780 [Ustilaginoidea virens]
MRKEEAGTRRRSYDLSPRSMAAATLDCGRADDKKRSPRLPASHSNGTSSGSAGVGIAPDSAKGPKFAHAYMPAENSDNSDAQSLSDAQGWGGKREGGQENEDDERRPKRPRMDDSPREDKSRAKPEDQECPWSKIQVPREAERMQQADRVRAGARRQASPASPASQASRHSSPSAQSSDLNSLEAELLGRPVKQKSPGKANPRRDSETHQGRTKPRRRRTNTNSAYRYCSFARLLNARTHVANPFFARLQPTMVMSS